MQASDVNKIMRTEAVTEFIDSILAEGHEQLEGIGDEGLKEEPFKNTSI